MEVKRAIEFSVKHKKKLYYQAGHQTILSNVDSIKAANTCRTENAQRMV